MTNENQISLAHLIVYYQKLFKLLSEQVLKSLTICESLTEGYDFNYSKFS